MEIIDNELNLKNIPPSLKHIIKRVIHATADFEFKESMRFHPEAVPTAIKALKAGKDILVDVEMVRAGISKNILVNQKLYATLTESMSMKQRKPKKQFKMDFE